MKTAILSILIAHAALAQSSPTVEPDADGPQPPYVRRVSAGGVLSVSAFTLIRKASDSQSATNYSFTSTTTPNGSRVGGGVVVQVRLSNRWAVGANALLRRPSFSREEITTVGTDSKITTENIDIRADSWEFPILVRRFSKSPDQPGRRWFYEAGPSFRRVRNIRSFRDVTKPDGTTTCCDEAPLLNVRKLTAGITAGAGLQIIDQFGLRFIPEIRYTRWLKPSFDTLSSHSASSQAEVILSITF